MPPAGAAAPPGPPQNKPGVRISSSGAMSSTDDAGRKQRKADDREEENQVAQVDHAALEAVEMRHHRERRDRVDQRRARPARKQVGNRVEAGEDQEQAEDHRQDEGDHLVARHRRGHAGDGEIGAGEEQAAEIARDDLAVVRIAHEARNLAMIACQGVIGMVSSSSSVPERRSSAHSRMPTAGTRTRYSQGCQPKKAARLASPRSKKLPAVKVKKPVSSRKITRNT